MTSSKIEVFLISCQMITHYHAILLYSVRSVDVYEHSFCCAHVERAAGSDTWKYRTIADMGRSSYLPERATRCNQPIEHTFTSAVEEAVIIARELGVLV